MLRETSLTLVKTDEICKASESTTTQMKLVETYTDPVQLTQLQMKKTRKMGRGDTKPKGKVTKMATDPFENTGTAEPFTRAQRKNYVQRSARSV